MIHNVGYQPHICQGFIAINTIDVFDAAEGSCFSYDFKGIISPERNFSLLLTNHDGYNKKSEVSTACKAEVLGIEFWIYHTEDEVFPFPKRDNKGGERQCFIPESA
ncbi:MAG: hypothetical protein V2A69_03635 [Pseudomonadota bacterium]